MTRYFPELVEAVKAELPERCVVDGEIVIATDGGLDFEALQQRIHPAASRVTMLARADAGVVHRVRPARPRRRRLHRAPVRRAPRRPRAGARRRGHADPPHPGDDRPSTSRSAGSPSSRAPGSTAWSPSRSTAPTSPTSASCSRSSTSAPPTASSPATAWHKTSTEAPAIGSLLLGPLQRRGHAAVTSASIGAFPHGAAPSSFDELQPLRDDVRRAPVETGPRTRRSRATRSRQRRGSRWNAGKDLSFVPLRPELVVEVRYDHMEGERFRHLAQFIRWRRDRTPESCTYEQLEQPVTFRLDDIVPGLGSAVDGRLGGLLLISGRRDRSGVEDAVDRLVRRCEIFGVEILP